MTSTVRPDKVGVVTLGAMPSVQRRADVGAADARRLAHRIGSELRDGRRAAGISLSMAASAAGMSASQLGRIERGELRAPNVEQICRAARALGLAASIQLYPAGSPVRDAAHLALLQRFEARLRQPLRLLREVPLPIHGDRRAWDGMVVGADSPVFTEAETHIHDAQALERRIGLKLRDDGRSSRVLLVAARTRHNRAVITEHRGALRELFPLDGAAGLRARAAGRVPDAGGILLL
jgi:transcriptional regulator with XRE-family HTH domain